MRKLWLLLPPILLVFAIAPVTADHAIDDRSDNMTHLENFDDDGNYGAGSDLAFWGNMAVAGNYSRPGGFRLLSLGNGDEVSEIGQFDCPGTQADVSIWKDLVFVSVDGPRTGPECGAPSANAAQVAAGQGWEGVRVVSISNPESPEQIAFVRTDCGSHTHTLLPDLGRKNPRLLIYVSSYPLTGHHPEHDHGGEGEPTDCGLGADPPAHQKISVVEVPMSDPASASVISEPYVGPGTIGCHDITVFMPEQLAAAACITESQIWDISDPVNPEIIGRMDHPLINIHHSSAWSWDGDTVILGDELGGAVATPGCTGSEDVPVGALWFFDVSNPEAPAFINHWRIPRLYPSAFCTAHNFNVVPLKSDQDILVSAWYNAGTTVLDFTDPANPQELGHYAPSADPNRQTAAWSSHWYNGLIYSNNFDQDVNSVNAGRGFDVFSIDHPDLAPSRTYNLPRLNPQTQEPIPGMSGPRNKQKKG